MTLVLILVACLPPERGCSAPGAMCVGSVDVDLSGDVPIFGLADMPEGATLPDALFVVTHLDRDVVIWDLWSIAEDGFPITWGEVPPGGEDVKGPNSDYPFELALDRTYSVLLGVRDADLNGPLEPFEDATGYGSGMSSDNDWYAEFTWGDPDSVVIGL